MDVTDYRRFHFPYIHGVLDEFKYDTFLKDLFDPALRIKTFKANNPDFPTDIKDKKILKRYLTEPFPIHVRRELNNMSLIPEYDEMIHNSQSNYSKGFGTDDRNTSLMKLNSRTMALSASTRIVSILRVG
jgi:hypothetical protein